MARSPSSKKMAVVNRKYKSTLFALIFRNKEELLKLYNAVAKKNYDSPDNLIINTLENAIYMSMKKKIYSRKRISLPAPKFIVFYNG